MVAVNEVKSDVDDFFSEEKMNKTVQLRISNIPLGTHRVKLLDISVKKARNDIKEKDRIEFLFEYVKSTDAGCVPGNKGTIAVFRGKPDHNYCEKTLVRFAQEGSGDTSINTTKGAIETLKLLTGFEVDCVCSVDTQGKKDKAGNYYNKYSFGLFDIKE